MTASRGWLGAQVVEPHDEIEDDLEEREEIVDTSDTIESGDEVEEVERAREDRRVIFMIGNPSRLPGLLLEKGRDSMAKRDIHMF